MELMLLSRNGGESRRFTLPNGEAMIGRRPDCHIVLDAPSISARHARVFSIDGHAVLYAVDAEWPVYVNDDAVNRHVLADGDQIELGHYRLRCIKEIRPATVEDPAPGEAPDPVTEPVPAADDDLETMVEEEPPAELVAEETPALPRRFHLDILSGINRGRRVALAHDRAVLGFNRQRLVEIHNTGQALSLRCINDEADARLNGAPLADEPVEARPGDILSLQRIELRIH